MKNIILIGSGNVATHLGLSLLKAGYNIKQVWSKKLLNAKRLAEKINSNATDNLERIKNADLYIIAVKDDGLESLIQQLDIDNIVHTSGSIGLEAFSKKFKNYGVFYPLQTFNKKIDLNFKATPICIEANNTFFKNELMQIGKNLTSTVKVMSSEQRKQLHIAAVFACNFTNHMFAIADSILAQNNIDFKLLTPIINQTVKKINQNKPLEVQTGPAERKEKNIIQSHINNLNDDKLKEIYKLISESIMRRNG